MIHFPMYLQGGDDVLMCLQGRYSAEARYYKNNLPGQTPTLQRASPLYNEQVSSDLLTVRNRANLLCTCI